MASDSEWLDGIIFNTSAWGSATDVDRLRWWKVGPAVANLRFLEMAPDFERLDLDYLRETFIESMGLVESQGWPLEQLRDISSRTMPTEAPTDNTLIEVGVSSIDGVPTVSHTVRFWFEDQVRFASTVMVLFKTCCWVLRLEVADSAPVGEREAAVFRALIEDTETLADLPNAIDPYERRWDGLTPLAADPLSRLRILMGDALATVHLGPVTANLERFSTD